MNEVDEKLTQFVGITGCSISEARGFLESFGWNIDRATDFYFGQEHDFGDKPNFSPIKPQQPVSPQRNQNVLSPKPVNPVKQSFHQSVKQTNLSPHIDHKEVQNKPEKLILSETHEKFNEIRLEAQNKDRWLLVLLTNEPLPNSILNGVELRNFTYTRYVPLEINKFEADGKWFSNVYGVKNCPFYAILDPATTELLDKHEGEMTSSQTYNFLENFLIKHPEKGKLIEFDVLDLYNNTQCSSSENESSDSESGNDSNKNDTETDKEDESKDPGTMVKVMIQLPNNKRTQINIGENEKIKVLYKKVSSLIQKNVESFKLVIPYPTAELSDMSKTIQEMKLKNSMIRVYDVV